PLTTLLPRGEPGYHDFSAYPFDPAAARRLLAEAGHADGKGLDLTYTYRQRDADQRVAEELQTKLLKNLGLQIKLQGIPLKDLEPARRAHQYDMFYDTWLHDYPDPLNWLSTHFQSRWIETANNPAYDDPEFDRLTKLADTLADPARRAE